MFSVPFPSPARIIIIGGFLFGVNFCAVNASKYDFIGGFV